MSTKYTREQISKARQLADYAFDMSKEDAKCHPGEPHPEKAWIDTFTEALGLDVEDEKPEPGTLLRHKETGDLAWTDIHGRYKCISPADGEAVWWATVTPDDFEPARVVPAEPVELSEEDYQDLWDASEGLRGRSTWMPWEEADLATRVTFRAGAEIAIAKHGRGRVEVSREQVSKALDMAMDHSDTACDLQLIRATNAIMELLEGTK